MSVFDIFNPLQNVTPRFTEEQLSEILEWFDVNNKSLLTINNEDPVNVITIDQLIDFLKLKKFHRRSFHYPSNAEIMKEVENLKAGNTRLLTKNQLLYILNKWVKETNLKHELNLAFKIFDTENRNFLDVNEIRAIVTGYGNIFNEAETRELLRDADVRGDGNIFYGDFIESLFTIAPELNLMKTDYLYKNPDEDPSVSPETIIDESRIPETESPPPLPRSPQSISKKANNKKNK